MHTNNIRVPVTFADIQPISHDMGKINLMLADRNKGELATLKAVNSLAREPYHILKKQQKKWQTFKALAIYASLIPLLITLLIYYISPMLTQSQFEFSDVRVWGMGTLMASVAFAVAVLIDLGRANILDKSNNTSTAYMLYFFMSTASILFSTVGMIAVADFYASSENGETKQTIATAKAYMIAHASMGNNRSLADIDTEEMRLTKLMHEKKSGYHPKDLRRDVSRLNDERKELKDYLSAKATVDGKRQLQNTDDSSNWLFNTYARILESNTATAGIVIGLLINFLSEAMALIAHMRLVKLNARLEVTEQQWSTATMVANEAMIVADSEISALNHLDYFAHTFKMPFNILHDYQNQNKRYGEFVSDNNHQASNDLGDIEVVGNNLSQIQIEAKARYDKAMEASVGEIVNCPHCSIEVEKKTYNHVFCSSTGTNNCKDEYHNILNPARIGARR
jgi:hypothetical protein